MGNVFGLGILLTLEDQASGRLGAFSNSLQNLSSRAMSLNYMGRSLIDTGKGMLSPLVGLSKEVIRVGDDAEKTRITLNALYNNDAQKVADVFNNVVNFAAKSPFGIEELKDATTQFKTLGVELFGTEAMVTSATGKTREMVEIIGDLGAGLSGVARNGFKDVVYASREFVTEGNKLSFLRRLGVDIDAVLEKGIKAENTMKQLSLSAGETVEERKVALANLVEALNMDGLMGEMQGTWSQMMSNMGDLWYKFCLKLGDAGSFKAFKKSFSAIQQFAETVLDSAEMDGFVQNIADAFDDLTGIIDVAVTKVLGFAEGLVSIGAKYPIVSKVILLFPALAGSLFMVAGAALMAKASMMVLGYGLGMVVGMIPQLLLYAGAFAVISTAWKNDIGGIKTRLTNFVETVKTSMSRAKEILAMESDDMVREYKNLVNRWDKAGDFGAGFTAQIIKTKVIWGAFVDFLKDNKVDPNTLGVLKDMGLLGTFEKIATWTARIKEFCSGVVEGFSDMANAVGDFVNNVMSKFFPTMGGDGNGLFNMITGSFDMSGITGAKGIGNFVAKALPAFLAIRKIVGIVNSISGRRNRNGLGDIIRNLMGRGTDANEATANTHGFANLMNSIGAIRIGTVVKGIANLGLIMTAFMGLATVFGGFVNLFGVDTIGKGIAALGALSVAMLPLGTPAFNTLINTLQRLARFKVKTIGKGILNLGVIVGGLAAISAISLSLMAIPTAFMDMGTMYGMVGILYLMGILGVALAQFAGIIGKVPVSTVALGLANMAIMLGGMAALYMVLGAVSLIPFDIGRIAQITLLIGLLGILGTALAVFGGIVGLIPVAVVALGLANMAIMLGGLSVLYMVLGAVSLIPFDLGRIAQLVLVIGLIGTVGAALSVFAGIVGALPVTLVLKGIVNIAIVLAGFGVLAYAFSAAIKYADKIEQGCEVIAKISKGIGKMVGSLVGGVLEGVTDSLPEIGSNLAGFVTNLNPLFNLAQNENATQIGTFFESLGKGLLALTKNDILSFFTGGTDFVGLAKDLSRFATALEPFFSAVARVDDGGLAKAPKIFESLSGINNQAFMSGGVNDWWNGSIDLTGLGTQLSNFATAIAPFYKAVASVDESAFGKAESMFQSLKVINNQAFMQGGVNDFWNGSIDLSNLGTMLSKFASSAGTFWTTVATWDESAFSKAESMFTALKGINDQAFMSGGVNDFWNGSIDLSGLGTMLSNFATNANTFFQKVQAFENPEKISMMFNALKDVSKLNEVQSGNLPTLGTNLSTFMSNASSFFTEAKTVDTSGLTTMATALQEFFNIINAVVITGLTNLSGSITSVVSSISSVNSQLLVMGQGFVTVGTTAVTAGNMVVVGMTLISTTAMTAGTMVITASTLVITGMTLMSSTSMAHAMVVVNAFTLMGNGITLSASVVYSGMMLMVTAVITGSYLMVSAISSACASCQGILAAFAASGTAYGAQLVSNIAAGISANAGMIRSAIQNAVASAAGSVSINVPINVGKNYNGTNNWVGGLTTINERGGELVDLPSGTRIYPHDKSVTMAFDEGVETAMSQMSGGDDNRAYDDSVHFHAGSIVVQANGASEAEAERLANLVINKIERKKKRKDLATFRV